MSPLLTVISSPRRVEVESLMMSLKGRELSGTWQGWRRFVFKLIISNENKNQTKNSLTH